MLTIGVLQIIPAIILIAYGLVKQKRFQVYFDMLLMALPATLFYGILMRILPEGLFEWYFYFFAKVVLFLLPGLIIIRLRKYKLRDFGITKEGLKLSLLLGFGILIITTLTNAILFIQNPEMTLAWSSQFVSPSNLIMIWSIPLFFDAFNEEFLFRGIFFFFAYKNTENLPLAYIVSMMVAFAWHPEFTLFRIIPIFVQGTLLCYLLYKSKNIHGAWISHGINRTSGSVVAQLLME
jgi:membrane protease YdiL (CAAX protease family)